MQYVNSELLEDEVKDAEAAKKAWETVKEAQ